MMSSLIKKKRSDATQPKAEAAPVTTEEYQKFLQSLRLVDICLDSGHFRIERRQYFSLLERENDFQMSIKMGGAAGRVGKDFFNAAAICEVVVTDTKDDIEVLSIEASFRVHFHGEFRDGHKAFIDQFVQHELRIIASPYLRQYVSDITARMSVPPITIPLSTAPGYEKSKRKKEKREIA